MTKTIDGRCGGAKWYKHSQWSSTLFSLSGTACVAANGPLSTSDNTLTQNKCWLSRVSSVSVRVTRLYTFKVCATQYFLMRATLSAVCMWCELNTVRLLGLEVWVGTRHDWLLSEVYQTFIISNLQPTTYFFPQSPVWRIAVPISHFISIDSDKNADLKLNGQLFPPKMMVETKSELKNKKCILDLLPDCQKKTT